MPTRVLIVDDSLLFREALSRALKKDPTIEVVGTACDAFDAEKKINELNPDVVTLDIEMPKMNGIEFLKKLLPKKSIPVVVVTSTPVDAFEALNAGAVDFVKKPVVKEPTDMDLFALKLRQMVKIAAVAKLRKKVAAASSPLINININQAKAARMVIAIGASTGGTEALQNVLRDLPPYTPGIVVVQHMPAGFTKMYAERLSRVCKMEVREASDRDRVKTGRIIIAAGGFHLQLKKDTNGYYVNVSEGEKVSGHCPSVDMLFGSVAETAGKDAVGVILTGMGADGAKGLKSMRDSGAYTIGQDKDSCVVYGMPKVANDIGGVVKQHSLEEIPAAILAQCK